MATNSDLFRRAQQCHQQGKLAEAEGLYEQILQADTNHAGAMHWLGMLVHQAGRHERGLQLVRQSLALEPMAAGYHFNLGNLLKDLGQPATAAECYRHALRLNPDHAKTHNNLGNVLMDHGNLLDAIGCYEEALRLDPRLAIAHYNLGVALRDQGKLESAAACFRQCLAQDSTSVEAATNLGIVLYHQGRYVEAASAFEQALHVDPRRADARYGRAILRMLTGDLEKGWRDYECRWQQPVSRENRRSRPGALAYRPMPARAFTQPQWDGAGFAGKTILIHAEQGLGDTLQFIRYAPLVKGRGGNVICECQAELVALLRGCAGIDAVVAAGGPLPAFDLQSPLLSLPGIFTTTLTTIPASVPYLHLDTAPIQRWREKLACLGGTVPSSEDVAASLTRPAPLKVGIVWQGSQRHVKDGSRSVPLRHFGALAAIDGVRLFSLQVGAGTEQLATAGFRVDDLGKELDPGSLLDLAAVLVSLDLVITIDSAPAHLAGALGVPVWVLLPFVPDWRWLLDREDSPWYPGTMKLYRQNCLGDWDSVFGRVRDDLRVCAKRGLAWRTVRFK